MIQQSSYCVLSVNDQVLVFISSASSMEMFTEDDFSQLATDYTQEDLDYNKLNEWLQNPEKHSPLFG